MNAAAIRIRTANWSDGDALIEANRESREFHHPWASPFVDRPGFEAWLARALTGPNVRLLGIEAGTGRIVGVVNLNEIVWGKLRGAFLGYYALVGRTGRGEMTEVVRLAVCHAFGNLGLHRLEANIQPGNARSRALVQRLGFRLEGFSPHYLHIDGEWRDHERWAITGEERPSGPAQAP